ncbi:hypothetical protein MUO32_26365 [Shinella sp. CPCC 101442]|uniref:hypothetical protein n=1 Tax=Shinella sp. CPCC 101442 TaxID=2932265 RepID=UPI0021523DA7|nr:hypothetical protein [Shinella sp. CPCC 101442]MCR6502556.1 hypothetical protein [Shinella sp. CPCC 101442]
MAEFFVVQSFSPAKRGMKADIAVQVNSVMHAKRMAERLALTKPMVFATVMEGDPESGDFGEPKLIYFHGAEKPEEVSNMQPI